MNNEKELQIYKFYNVLRGNLGREEATETALLIFLLSKEFGRKLLDRTPEQAWEAALRYAEASEIRMHIRDSRFFYMIYEVLWNVVDMEEILALTLKDKERVALPAVLVPEFVKHFTANTKTVFIPEAERFVPYLTKIVSSNLECRFTISSKNFMYCKILEAIFMDYRNVSVVKTDIYQYEFLPEQFDLIFSIPTFGGRDMLERQSNFICRELDMVALENLLLHITNQGKLVIVLPAKVTFALGRTETLRKFVQDNYKIEEIAELPKGTFPLTGIRTYLFSIANGNTEDIIIKKFAINNNVNSKNGQIENLITEKETFAMKSELEDIGDWNLDKLFAQQDEEWIEYLESEVKKERLITVASIFRGKAITRKDPNGPIGVVNISNIGDYEVDYENLDHINEEERRIINYLLQEGDLLIPARGTVIRTAIFHEQNYPCIASSNIIVVRVNPKKILSAYLKLFLDSPLGGKLLNSAQQGVTVMSISHKDVGNIEVPVPEIEEQKQTVDEYEKEYKNYKDAIDTAEKRWREVLEKLQRF